MYRLGVLTSNPANDLPELNWGVRLEEQPALLLTDAWMPPVGSDKPSPPSGLLFPLYHKQLGLDGFWGPFQLWQQRSPTNDLAP